jgi:hypothetical protein
MKMINSLPLKDVKLGCHHGNTILRYAQILHIRAKWVQNTWNQTSVNFGFISFFCHLSLKLRVFTIILSFQNFFNMNKELYFLLLDSKEYNCLTSCKRNCWMFVHLYTLGLFSVIWFKTWFELFQQYIESV